MIGCKSRSKGNFPFKFCVSDIVKKFEKDASYYLFIYFKLLYVIVWVRQILFLDFSHIMKNHEKYLCFAITKISCSVLQLLIGTHFTEMFIKYFGDNITTRDNRAL